MEVRWAESGTAERSRLGCMGDKEGSRVMGGVIAGDGSAEDMSKR
jgi:hypothetical protein